MNLTNIVEQNLSDLRLHHWKKILTEELSTLKPEQQQCLLNHLKKASALEIAERHTHSIERRIEDAKFVRLQTVDHYDFEYNKSTRALKNSYLKLHHETSQGSVPKAVFVGTTGLGKTHLARALGLAACQASRRVLFTKASDIVNALSTAKAIHTLDREIKKYRKPELLIIDEMGYVTMDLEASNLFFQVISDRHDRNLGTIVTTNYPFGQWNQIFASDSTAVVIVERLTADAEIFYLEGPSYSQEKRKNKKSK